MGLYGERTRDDDGDRANNDAMPGDAEEAEDTVDGVVKRVPYPVLAPGAGGVSADICGVSELGPATPHPPPSLNTIPGGTGGVDAGIFGVDEIGTPTPRRCGDELPMRGGMRINWVCNTGDACCLG